MGQLFWGFFKFQTPDAGVALRPNMGDENFKFRNFNFRNPGFFCKFKIKIFRKKSKIEIVK